MTGSLTDTSEEFLGECGPEVVQLMPELSAVDEDVATAAVFAGLEEKYWYTIAGGTIFLGIVFAVVWGVRKNSKSDLADLSMPGGSKVVLGPGYMPVSPTNMPSMLVGGTPNHLAATTPYSPYEHSYGHSPRSPGGDYQGRMQSFFPADGVPPRMLSNESVLSQGSVNGMTLWQYLEARERGQSGSRVRSPLVSRDADGVALILACATPDAVIYYTVDKTLPVPPNSQSSDASLFVGSAEGAKQGALNAVRQALRENRRAASQTPALAGAGTHRYDSLGPNNLLRITDAAAGEEPLEVRCVAVKAGMAASMMVTHVDQKPRTEFASPKKTKPPPLNLASGFGEMETSVTSFPASTNL